MAGYLTPKNVQPSILPGEYGHFANDGAEFVITTPRTPTPWVNVLANENYGMVMSQAGGGFSWHKNSQLGRLTRWENDLIQDRQGRFIYLQDTTSGDIWSTTYQPTLIDSDEDEVVYGMGYSEYRRNLHGVRSSQTVFVPTDDACEVWIVTLENLSARQRTLRVAAYAEWFLSQPGEFHREFHRLFIETKTVGNAQIAWKHPGLHENERSQPEMGAVAFLAVNGVPVTHVLSDKQATLGVPARLDKPEALVNNAFTPGNGRWEDPCAMIISDIVLEPGQTISFTYSLGASDNMPDTLKLSEKYTLKAAETELAKVKEAWQKLTDSSRLRTDDEALDVMVNYWLPYQIVAGRMVARCAYYQQGGAYGYRDQLQDSLALLSIDPQRTKRQIGIQASAMYEDGGVRHWWHPNTQIFAESKHSDTCLWLAYGTLAYLEETADFGILNEEYSFLNRSTQLNGERGTLLEHCLRGIQRTLDLRSKRGLPLILAGDWNDGLSHAGLNKQGESAWVAMFLFDILTRFVPVLRHTGNTAIADKLAAEAESLRHAVNTYAWDGEWYIEGTNDEGRPLGGKENKSGQIYLNPQTWAVISGIAPADRATTAMKAVKERLIKPYGALLLTPAYAKVDPWVGYITRYAPGSRENGGVYSHASTWAVQALARMGDHHEALKVFRGMLPSAKADRKHYSAEPYVMPGNIDGPDSPTEGKAGWTWYTGSAAWMRRTALEWLCGIRPTIEGLHVETEETAINDFFLKRKFRGETYDFEVQGGDAPALTVDGKPTSGLLVPSGSGQTHQVTVTRLKKFSTK